MVSAPGVVRTAFNVRIPSAVLDATTLQRKQAEADCTNYDQREVKQTDRHQVEERIGVGERGKRPDIRVHDRVGHNMKDRAEQAGYCGGAASNLRINRQVRPSKRRIATERMPPAGASTSRQSSIQQGGWQSVKQAVERPLLAQKVVTRLEIDGDLRAGEERKREVTRSGSLREKAKTAMERSDWHAARRYYCSLPRATVMNSRNRFPATRAR